MDKFLEELLEALKKKSGIKDDGALIKDVMDFKKYKDRIEQLTNKDKVSASIVLTNIGANIVGNNGEVLALLSALIDQLNKNGIPKQLIEIAIETGFEED